MRYIVKPYYRLMPGLNVFIEYEHEQAYEAFKTLQSNDGESTSEDSLMFGLGLYFNDRPLRIKRLIGVLE